jgi:predicted dehydrogenase
MTQRVIHVGVGSFGQRWCRERLAGNIVDRTIEVVAVVDVRPEAAALGGSILRLPPERCFTDARTAFAGVPADFCTIAVPSEFHEGCQARQQTGLGAVN